MKKILVELEEKELVEHKIKEKILIIKKLENFKKTVKVETDPKTGDGFVNIEEFKDIVDISKVDSYKLYKEKNGKALKIEFFDKDGNELKSKR